MAIPNVLTHEKSYDHSFMKKHDGHILFSKSRFDQFSHTVSEIQNTAHSQCINPIDNVRAWFTKNRIGDKLSTKSRFDQLFMNSLKKSK
ncbi:hypothetical protein GW17_00048404 [Ensete ventricosum]|nr:hypothetical protein GW17_00048404 [Ensete ventricosum]